MLVNQSIFSGVGVFCIFLNVILISTNNEYPKRKLLQSGNMVTMRNTSKKMATQTKTKDSHTCERFSCTVTDYL